MNAVVTITGPADLRDQQWLDERIEAAHDGIEAVIEIAENWTTGRNLSRLHPGVSAVDYIREHVGIVGRGAIVPLLERSNWSNRQIAAVAGVSPDTVDRTARNQAVERPAETLGADGKLRPTPIRMLDRREPPKPSPEAAAALDLLIRVASLDADRVVMTMTPTQHARIRNAASRARPVIEALAMRVIEWPKGGPG